MQKASDSLANEFALCRFFFLRVIFACRLVLCRPALSRRSRKAETDGRNGRQNGCLRIVTDNYGAGYAVRHLLSAKLWCGLQGTSFR